jgi:hypothetical protein
MMFRMPGISYQGALQPLTATEKRLQEHRRGHVQVLAGQIGERNLWHPRQLEAAGRIIEDVLKRCGLAVARQSHTAVGLIVDNIEAEWVGKQRPGEIIVVGAHYDSVVGSPGANDNGSGVAALLEIAAMIAARNLPRTLRLVGPLVILEGKHSGGDGYRHRPLPLSALSHPYRHPGEDRLRRSGARGGRDRAGGSGRGRKRPAGREGESVRAEIASPFLSLGKYRLAVYGSAIIAGWLAGAILSLQPVQREVTIGFVVFCIALTLHASIHSDISVHAKRNASFFIP